MVTIIIILLVAVVGLLVWGYDKYKEQLFVANTIDGSGIVSQHISANAQNVLDQLKDIENLKYKKFFSQIILPDNQILSTVTDTLEVFIGRSDLTFEPSKLEWKIFKSAIDKIVKPHL